MSRDRCARCGRLSPDDDPAPDRRAGDPRGVLAPWASIGGVDVCPDCQTPLERREAAMRAVAAIEAEIERRRREGIAPNEIEAALVAYAMSVRNGLEGASKPAAESPTSPHGRLEPISRTGRSQQLRVAMTGAFLTGHPLAVRIAGYPALQSDLDGALRGPGWRVHRLHAVGGTYYGYGGGFAEALPLIIARREGPELLSHLRYELGQPQRTARAIPGYDLEPTDLKIDVYDLGVAVLTAWFDVSAPADAELSALAHTLKKLAVLGSDSSASSPIAEALQEMAHDATEKYAAAVRAAVPDDVQSSWLSSDAVTHGATSSTGASTDEHGRLLWLHPVNVREEETPSQDTVKQLAPVFHQTIDVGDAQFAPGIGWSAIVGSPGSSGAETAVRLTQLHWAYYALYMEMDRGLLMILNRGGASTNASLKALEREAANVFGDYMRVMEARARLDTELTGLGGDEFAIWRVLADVQRFDAVVEAVERKINVLERLTARRVDESSGERARRTAKILGGLTVLTVLTVAIALIGYFFGTIKAEGLHGTWLRIAVVAGACASAFAIWWVAFSERLRLPRRRMR